MLPYLSDCVLDDLLISHVALVAYEQLVDTLGGVSVDLLQPLLDVIERVHIGDIVDDADAVSATVVRGRDRAEALLAGSIPLQAVAIVSSYFKQQHMGTRATYDLKLHRLSVQLDRPDFLGCMSAVSSQRHLSHWLEAGYIRADIRSQHRWWKCRTLYRYRRRIAAAGRTFQHQSLR